MWKEKNKKVSKGKKAWIEVSRSSCVLVDTHPFVAVYYVFISVLTGF